MEKYIELYKLFSFLFIFLNFVHINIQIIITKFII